MRYHQKFLRVLQSKMESENLINDTESQRNRNGRTYTLFDKYSCLDNNEQISQKGSREFCSSLYVRLSRISIVDNTYSLPHISSGDRLIVPVYLFLCGKSVGNKLQPTVVLNAYRLHYVFLRRKQSYPGLLCTVAYIPTFFIRTVE